MPKKLTNRPANSPKNLNISRPRPKASDSGRAEPLSPELRDAIRLNLAAFVILQRANRRRINFEGMTIWVRVVSFEDVCPAVGSLRHRAAMLGVSIDIPAYDLAIFDEKNQKIFHFAENEVDEILLITFQRGTWEKEIEKIARALKAYPNQPIIVTKGE